MAEHLHLRSAVAADDFRVVGGKLPGQHHPLHAQLRRQTGSGQGVQAHLSAGVEGLIRGHLPGQKPQAPVLHQHRVHAPGACLAEGLRRLGQLPVGEEGVEGQVDLHPMPVAVVHGLGKGVIGKIPGAAAGVEAAQAHVHGIGPVLHGGQQGLRRPGRGEKLHYFRPCCWAL